MACLNLDLLPQNVPGQEVDPSADIDMRYILDKK